MRKLLDGVANVHRPKTNCRWSAFGDEHIDGWIGVGDWDVIHFNFGLWDWYGWRQDCKATPASYARSLDSIVRKIRAKSKASLIFGVTTPPCIGSEKNAKIVVSEERAKEFNQAALEVMRRHKVGINNLYDVIEGKRAELQKGKDDVHYNDAGRDLLAAQVASRIKIDLGKLPAKSASPRKPNILFLFADDQRADTIGAHGNPHIRTPHLDQLAADGFSFRRNYCGGSFSGAVCVAKPGDVDDGQALDAVAEEQTAIELGGFGNPAFPAGQKQDTIISLLENGITVRAHLINASPKVVLF